MNQGKETLMTDREEKHAVFWPRGERKIDVQPSAPRVDSLEGRTVAFLWDYLFRGDEIFPMIEKGLRERFPGINFIGYEAFGSTHGEDEQQVLAALPEKLRALGVDAAISGMGC